MTAVLGLDLSLTSTGMSNGSSVWTVKPMKRTGYERLRYICEEVTHRAWAAEPDLVCVEGPSYGSKGGHEHERGGLWWMVTEQLDREGWPVVVVPPSSLKKFATGKGNANKDAMVLATARRFSWFDGGNDEADALWLAAMGYDHLSQPLVEMPALNRTALSGVTWPEQQAA